MNVNTEELQSIMREKHWTVNRLAVKADIDVNTVRRIIKLGRCRPLTLSLIAQALEVSGKRLIAKEDGVTNGFCKNT